MKESSGSQFFNTTTEIPLGPDTLNVRYSLLYHLWSNNHVAQCNVSSAIESWMFMARITKIRIFKEEFSKDFSLLSNRSQNFWTIKQRKNGRLSSIQNTVRNTLKVTTAIPLQSNGMLCPLSIAILSRFTNLFKMTTSMLNKASEPANLSL